MKTSPTQRSLKFMRDSGYFCAITEKWNAWIKQRQDLFGFIDILCLRDNETVAVQTTSGSNVSARVEKILGLPAAKLWVASPHRKIVVHGWKKSGPRGQRKIWNVREVHITPEQFNQENHHD